MIVDWATVVGTAVGGIIAMSGELIGRLGARKDADRRRRETLEDAQRIRTQAIEDERAREIWQRSRQSAEKIIATIRNNRVSIVDPVGTELDAKEVVKRALEICLELYAEGMSIIQNARLSGVSLIRATVALGYHVVCEDQREYVAAVAGADYGRSVV